MEGATLKIVFMGTPDFAVPCLDRLLADGHSVCGVFTQPDRPAGRGHKVQPPPVKQLAQQHGIPVLQPDTLRSAQVQATLATMNPDLVVVVAYGKLLPAAVLCLPRLGCVNVHASLLPRWRGAAPVQHAVWAGDAYTGVTTMQMDEGLDTGDMLLCAQTAIEPEETAPQLLARLSALGAVLLRQTITALEAGTLVPQKQVGGSTYAPMLSRSNSPIDWTSSAASIHNQIRALAQWPVAVATLAGEPIKIHLAARSTQLGASPAQLQTQGNRLFVGCGDGAALEILQVQPHNGKRLTAAEFINGRQGKWTGAFFDC